MAPRGGVLLRWVVAAPGRAVVRALALVVGVAVSRGALAHEDAGPRLRALDGALERAPGDVGLLVERARMRRLGGMIEGASADLRRAHDLAPERGEPWLEVARLDDARGDRGRALADLAAALAAPVLGASARAEALDLRALIHEDAGRLDHARADLDAAVTVVPTPERVLARGRVDEARGDLEAAAEGYRDGIRRLGPAVVLVRALVRVARARGDLELALTAVDAVMAGAQVKAEWRLERATLLAAAGDASGARREREAALAELDATRASDLRRLLRARALIGLGRLEEARREVDGARERGARLPGLERLDACLKGQARGAEGEVGACE